MTAAEMLTILQPCLHGPLTHAAMALILSGDVNQFPSVLAFAKRILQAHRYPPPGNKNQRMGELLYRWRRAKDRAADDECDLAVAKDQLREAFSDLTDNEFERTTGPNPAGRYYEIANQMRFRQL